MMQLTQRDAFKAQGRADPDAAIRHADARGFRGSVPVTASLGTY
jgi:hypothetical protein